MNVAGAEKIEVRRVGKGEESIVMVVVGDGAKARYSTGSR